MSCLLILLLSMSVLISSALVARFDPGLPAISGASLASSRVQAPSSFTLVNVPIVEENSHDRQQVEPTIAIDPRNPNIIVAGAQDYRLKEFGQHRWHGYYRSTDGGQTWTSMLLPGFPGDPSPEGIASPLHRSNTLSDPVLAFDRKGDVYYTGIAFNITNGVAQSSLVAFVAKYVNDGADYSGATVIHGPLNDDKPWIVVDTSGGQYDGNVYLAFDANLTSTSHFATVLTHSSDGGRNFSEPFYVPKDETGELPGLTVDPSGDVYVSSDCFNPVTGASLNYVQVSKVTNGGTSLAHNVKAVTNACFLGLSSTLPGGSFRDFTIPQIASDSNAVYLVRDDRGLGSSNVLFTKSMDGGITWTSSIMVNDFVTGTRTCCVPTQHFFPSIAVSGGIVNIAWYDSRLNNATTLNTLDVYYAYSMSGGKSFSPNIRVTTASFDPNAVRRSDAPNNNEPFIGDYIQIAATPISAHVIWTDNRFACDTVDMSGGYSCQDQDAMTARIDPPDFNLATSPKSLSLVQGQTGTANVTLGIISGFSGNVTIVTSISPEGLRTTTPAPEDLNVSADGNRSFLLYFSPTFTTPPRTYTMNITGSSGPRLHTAILSLTVQPFASFPSPGALRFPSFNGPNAIYVYIGVILLTVAVGLVCRVADFPEIEEKASPSSFDTYPRLTNSSEPDLASSQYVDVSVFSSDIGNVCHTQEQSCLDNSRYIFQLLMNDFWSAKVSEVCVHYQVPIICDNRSHFPGSLTQYSLLSQALYLCQRRLITERNDLHRDRLLSAQGLG